MLMEAHFQRPLLAQFPGGREPQHHNAAPAALQSLPQLGQFTGWVPHSLYPTRNIQSSIQM